MAEMNNNDLISLLMERHKVSQPVAQLFVESITNCIQDGIVDDSYVKVKGLGTFKLINVDERESVNVNNGERVVIPSHQKLTFLADAEMRALVNKPFALFEAVALNDGVQFSDTPTMQDGEDEEDGEEDSATADNDAPDTVPEEETDGNDGKTDANDEFIIEIADDEDTPVEDTPADNTDIEDSPADNTDIEDSPADNTDNEVTPADNSDIEVTPADNSEDDEDNGDADDPADDSDDMADDTDGDAADNDDDEDDAQIIEYGNEEPKRKAIAIPWKWLLTVLVSLGVGFAAGYFIGGNSSPFLSKPPVVTLGEKKTDNGQQKADAPAAATTPEASTSGTATTATTPEASTSGTATTPEASTSGTATTPEVSTSGTATTGEKPIWEKYDEMDRRTHNGYYYIMGQERTEKVREGDNSRKIAKRVWFSTDMACYLEVFNGIKADTELEPGSEVKIPKLEPKPAVKKRLKQQQQ